MENLILTNTDKILDHITSQLKSRFEKGLLTKDLEITTETLKMHLLEIQKCAVDRIYVAPETLAALKLALTDGLLIFAQLKSKSASLSKEHFDLASQDIGVSVRNFFEILCHGNPEELDGRLKKKVRSSFFEKELNKYVAYSKMSEDHHRRRSLAHIKSLLSSLSLVLAKHKYCSLVS